MYGNDCVSIWIWDVFAYSLCISAILLYGMCDNGFYKFFRMHKVLKKNFFDVCDCMCVWYMIIHFLYNFCIRIFDDKSIHVYFLMVCTEKFIKIHGIQKYVY